MASFFRIIDLLIYWENRPIDAELSRGEAKFIQIVSELLRSRRKGYHLVVIEPDLCDELLKLNFSDPDKAIIRKISDEYTQTGAVIDTLRPAISIAPSEFDDITICNEIYSVPLKLLEITKVLEPPSLIVENAQRDGYLLELAISHHSSHPISYNTVHGGGADIHDVFEMHLEKGGVIACAVDSDRFTPASLRNEKLSGLVTRQRRVGWPLAFPLSPECREIENMLSPEIVFSLPSAYSNGSIEVVRAILSGQPDDPKQCFWSYFDIKEGVLHGKVSKLNKDERDWIVERLSLAGIRLFAEGSSDLGEDPKNYAYIKGFGSKVIDQFKRSSSERKNLEHFKSYMSHPRWVAAFSAVVTALCAVFSSNEPLET